MLHYFLTGSEASRKTVIDYGQYVIDADDGRKTIVRFLDRGFTGHVSTSAFDHYYGPGRTPANAINALLDAYRLTDDEKFLGKADQLIRRCIHPADDLVSRNLLDAENRWFYTMFLQSLGKYIECKAERGGTDEMYAYAWNSFLHYARWAVKNEYPYLTKPERLEFPTETWDAQDMRKSEVFNLAALMTEGTEREQFLNRARFFFDSSVSSLSAKETRTLCRPVVLLLTHGSSQAWFDREPLEVWPPPGPMVSDLGEPTRFEGQKQRALRKAKFLTLTGAAIGLLLLALYLT